MCRRGKKNRRISDSVKLFKIIAIIHIFHKIKKIKIFSKKVLTFLWKAVIIYLVKRTTAKTTKKCRSGGIGRRAGFRCLWSQDRVGSSPISCIIFRFAYQELVRWTNSDYPAWNDAETSRQGLFISVRRRCADGERKTDESQTV